MEGRKEKKGVGIKVFGVCLIILGSLNMMLCWRGALEVYLFYPVTLLAGIIFFIFGTIRSNSTS